MKNDYERFGEVIRYLTSEELSLFFDSIDNYKHKLMFQVIFELGCRVGEFVRIQVKHINFNRSEIFIPAENTKTKHARSSFQHKMGSFGKFASRGQLPAFRCQMIKLIHFFPRKTLKKTKKFSAEPEGIPIFLCTFIPSQHFKEH